MEIASFVIMQGFDLLKLNNDSLLLLKVSHHSLGPLNECNHCALQVLVFSRRIREDKDLRFERSSSQSQLGSEHTQDSSKCFNF